MGDWCHEWLLLKPRIFKNSLCDAAPIQRQLGLSTVEFNLVPGPVAMSARDLSYAQGTELLQVLRQRKLPALSASSGPELGLD